MRLENNTENLGLALSDSIKSEYLEELGTDILELIADSLTDSDIISDIPIVGMFYKAGKSLISIRDKLFLKKILVFLQAHYDIPLEKRIKFLSQFETEKDKQEFGEAVLMLLDSLNNIRKAEIIGKLSRALFLSVISQNEFSILCESVHRIVISDIDILIEATKFDENNIPKPANESIHLASARLSNSGLMDSGIQVYLGDYGIGLKANKYGRLLVEIIHKY